MSTQKSVPFSLWRTYVAETVEGLEQFASRELRDQFANQVRAIQPVKAGELRFDFSGETYLLRRPRTIEAIFSVQDYPIPRPKALLGDQHWRRLLEQVNAVRDRSFSTFRIGAAGAESSVMQRIREEFAQATGLIYDAYGGDLLLRIRPTAARDGWETLVRLTSRPLSARPWRVCNYEGALNATVAATLCSYLLPREAQVVINLCAGSATFLAEGAALEGQTQYVGLELDPMALDCAQQNIAASRNADAIRLIAGDAAASPFANDSADALVADLPFGQRVGSHKTNVRLYPALMREAARIAPSGTTFAVVTHEIQLLERVLAAQEAWRTTQEYKITLRGLHPRIYLLGRT